MLCTGPRLHFKLDAIHGHATWQHHSPFPAHAKNTKKRRCQIARFTGGPCIILIHQINMFNTKNKQSSCKYNNMKIMATVVNSWLQLVDMQLFTMYYLYVCKHVISMFSTQKDEVPLKGFDMPYVGKCCVHQDGWNEK